MKIKYILNETLFTNSENLDRHWEKHVLKQDEPFNSLDPKFPNMTKDQYDKFADELSNMTAWTSKDINNPDIPVIGFVLKDGRRVKFLKHCRYWVLSKFPEEVIYVDDDKKGHETISYMLCKPDKIIRELRNFASELPENIKDKTTEESSDYIEGKIEEREE